MATGLLVLRSHCPDSGIGFTKERREFHRLKNRTTIPQQSDFDPQVTLSNLLHPGDDRARWSQSRAGAVEGYVSRIERARPELANCYAGCDTHLDLAVQPNEPLSRQLVLEVTPKMEEWAKRQGLDWSEETLQKQLLGHWVRFEGWLLFDSQHADESENISPGNSNNWRATAWELHPITKIEVIR